MITYAQNFEDVILARAFGARRDGFYVDIGACFPDIASVTKHFYDLGWSGVNVEPMEEPYRRLCEQRARDVNLRAAIGSKAGEIAIFPGPTVGESSALRHDAHAEGVVVPCLTLAELCRRHVPRAIDFLKIDVEGLELDVLAGGDWIAHRPRVIVVEVSEPWRTVRRADAERIDAVLRAAGYREAYYDGLNAFFVAHEAEALAPLLALPPNVLDGFASPREAQYDALAAESTRSAERADAAEKHAHALGRTLDDERQRAQQTLARAEALDQKLDKVGMALRDEQHRAQWALARCDIFEKHAASIERWASAAVAGGEQQLAAARAETEQARRWGETAVADLERRLRDMHAQLEQSEARARRAEASFATIERSRSWRIMAPLRGVGRAMRGMRAHARQPAALARRAMRGAIFRGKRTHAYARVAPLLKRHFPMAWMRGREAMATLTKTPEVPPLPVAGSVEPSLAPPGAGDLSAQSIADMILQEAARQRRT